MKGWKLTEPFTLEETELTESENVGGCSKIRITKALVSLSDVLRYRGNIDCENVVLGSSGIGIVSETDANLFGLEKGKHIYVEPCRECGECYNCKNREYDKCLDRLVAGEDYDGFLKDFMTVPHEKLFVLPDSVSDFEALFIGHISLAIAVIDKLGVQKGDYVTVVGANDFGNILAQLLIYYQAVPIVLTTDDESYEIAKNSGIYYTLGKDDNWQKEVSSITGGRMTDKVVYIYESDIPIVKAFSLASFNAAVAITGITSGSISISFTQAIKKQLDILCINNGFGNAASSINLIANKAINLSQLKLDTAAYDNVPETFKKLSDEYEKTGKIYETIVDLI